MFQKISSHTRQMPAKMTKTMMAIALRVMDYETLLNEDKRTINVIDADLIDTVVSQFKALIQKS